MVISKLWMHPRHQVERLWFSIWIKHARYAKTASRERKSGSKEVYPQCKPNGTQVKRKLSRIHGIAVFRGSIVREFYREGTRRLCGQQSAKALFAKCPTFFLAKVSPNSISEVFVAMTTPIGSQTLARTSLA